MAVQGKKRSKVSGGGWKRGVEVGGKEEWRWVEMESGGRYSRSSSGIFNPSLPPAVKNSGSLNCKSQQRYRFAVITSKSCQLTCASPKCLASPCNVAENSNFLILVPASPQPRAPAQDIPALPPASHGGSSCPSRGAGDCDLENVGGFGSDVDRG